MGRVRHTSDIEYVSRKPNFDGIHTPALVTAAANLGPAATFMPVKINQFYPIG